MYRYRKVGVDTFQMLQDGELSSEIIVFNRDNSGKVRSVTNDGSIHNKLSTEKFVVK